MIKNTNVKRSTSITIYQQAGFADEGPKIAAKTLLFYLWSEKVLLLANSCPSSTYLKLLSIAFRGMKALSFFCTSEFKR
jgi:hypothetical protein